VDQEQRTTEARQLCTKP